MTTFNFVQKVNKRFKAGAALAALVIMALPVQADAPSGNFPPLASTKQQYILKTSELIHKNLVTLPNYGVFDDLSFSMRGSEVILKGYASRPTLKKDAERIVKSVEGVKSVVNKIEVLPLSGFDDQIRLRTYLAIYRNPNLRKYSSGGPLLPMRSPAWTAGGITNNPPVGWNPIHIIVKNGKVTLTGVVDRDMDKQIIGMAVNRVPGVFSVNNNLGVGTAQAASATS